MRSTTLKFKYFSFKISFMLKYLIQYFCIKLISIKVHIRFFECVGCYCQFNWRFISCYREPPDVSCGGLRVIFVNFRNFFAKHNKNKNNNP